jgi:phenylacetate-CoA ligase
VFPMLESVSGKYLDAITGSNGAPVSPSVLTFAFKRMDQVRKSQVAQTGPASWEVRVVPLPGFTPVHQQDLIDVIHRMVDPHVLVKIVLKDDLPNTAAGKFRWVVNEYAPPANRPG